MKKLLMITALCALIVSFTGCGNGNENNDNLDSEVNSGTVVSSSPEVDKEPELQPKNLENESYANIEMILHKIREGFIDENSPNETVFSHVLSCSYLQLSS